MATHANDDGLGARRSRPSVLVLFLWMIVPLAMTIWFSLLRYNLLDPGNERFVGLLNYDYFLTDPAFFAALGNTLMLVGAVLIITVVGGTLLALLLDQPIFGRSIVRLMVIAPFFVMPTVSALVWKNLLMHPVSGLFAWITKSVGLRADRLVRRCAAAAVDHHRRLAVAALRDPDPAHRASSRSTRSRRRRPRWTARRRSPSSSTSCCRIWRGRSPSSS